LGVGVARVNSQPGVLRLEFLMILGAAAASRRWILVVGGVNLGLLAAMSSLPAVLRHIDGIVNGINRLAPPPAKGDPALPVRRRPHPHCSPATGAGGDNGTGKI
jgi:hypothetical protein